jgi:hypothetical protein
MSKGSVDDVKVWHAENQFVDRDSRKQVRFAGKAIVGRIIQFIQVRHLRWGKPQPRQHTLTFIEEAAWDQAACIVLREIFDFGWQWSQSRWVRTRAQTMQNKKPAIAAV